MHKFRTGDSAVVREMNLASVSNYVHRHAPLSRAQLATFSGLNKSTVSSLVDELIDRGLLHETGLENNGPGRPGTLLKLNPHAGCIVGVEIAADEITVILTDFVGHVLWRGQELVDISICGQQQIIDNALRLLDQAIDISKKSSSRLLGIGVTLPGMVDVTSGILAFSPNLQWHNVPLGSIFRQHTGAKVLVDNDANAAAMAEHLFGVASNAQNFVCLIAGIGLGGGLFLNGELYRGAGGFAGEIGHTTLLVETSRPCRCGNRGCWENTANQYALIERVRARLSIGRNSIIPRLLSEHNSPITIGIITEAADAGDTEAIEALTETGTVIGLGSANLINIFNPEMVVIGGSMSIAGKYILPAVKKAVAERSLTELQAQSQVVLSAFGPDASVMGAVAMVIVHILKAPTSVDHLESLAV